MLMGVRIPANCYYHYYVYGVVMYWISIDVWVSHGWDIDVSGCRGGWDIIDVWVSCGIMRVKS